MALLGGETNFVGIDIGSSGIRLVQLKHGGGKPLLVTYGEVPAPGGVTVSDSAIDRAKVAQLLADLAGQIKVSTKLAIAGVPSAKVYTAVATVPQMSKAELAKGITYQAERLIPVPLEKLRLAWSPIEGHADAKSIEVLIVATPIQTTDKYVEICEKAGFDLTALEPNAMATSRSLAPSQVTALILDIGGLMADITVLQAGVPRIVKAVPIGGLTFAKSVAQHLGVDEAQADQFIRKFGLTQDKLEGQVLEGLRPAVDSLVTEIAQVTQAFGTQSAGATLEKIILTGSATLVPGLPAYIATATKMPVEIGNPWSGIAYPATLQAELTNQAATYAVAAGLAMKEDL